jgi:TRAP transporter 4TM/12TM fusion protein
MNTQKFRRVVVFVFSIFLALFHLYNGGYRPITADLLRCIHVGAGLTIIFMARPVGIGKPGWALFWDILFALGTIAWTGYFTITLDAVPMRTGNPILSDILISTIGLVVLFEATRRVLGWALPCIAGVFLAYALLGQYVPGPLGLRSIDYPWLITHSLLTSEGVFGIPIGVSAGYVFLFILFSAALDKTGGGKFFLDLSQALLGRFRGGPAKVAVVASALMGTISGSAVANVAGTGCITIPLMKKLGYKPKTAGAIEAVASSGGIIMPPIMGAAAFIMSEFLGIPYAKIMVAAAIPAVLYYVTVFAAVDFQAALLGLKGLPPEELPKVWKTLKQGFLFIIPLMVLVVEIFLSTPQRAAFWGFIVVIILFVVNICLKKDFKTAKNILPIVEESSKQALSVIAACAVAGIVVGVISLTGLGFMLTGVLLSLGGKSMVLVLLISMVTSLVLGMGLPITACYIILAVIAAPGMVDLGVNPIAAHLFIIYFGMLSGITPPVALAAYVGAGIAEDKPTRVALEACKIGLVAFLLPYMFLYNPTLLLQNVKILRLIVVLVGGFAGAYAIAAGTQGYLLTRANWIQRLLLLSAAVLLLSLKVYTYWVAFAFVALVALWQRVTIARERKERELSTSLFGS